MADGACEEANLTYWAYWVGCDPEPASTQQFMIERRLDMQRAGALLRHLVHNLSAELPYADLSVHSIKSLACHWPDLLRCDPSLAAALCRKAASMLDDAGLPNNSRKTLADVYFAARRACGPLLPRGI
jgi:hypothetical protein